MNDQMEELTEMSADHIGRTVRNDEVLRYKIHSFDGGFVNLVLAPQSKINVSKGNAGFFLAERAESVAEFYETPFPKGSFTSNLFRIFSYNDPDPPVQFYQGYPDGTIPNPVNEKAMRAVVARQIELMTSSFDKSQTYTTVTMVAGYAGFISLWDKLSDQTHPLMDALIGLSIGISLAAFVFFEVFKMWTLQQVQLSLSQMNSIGTWEGKFSKLISLEGKFSYLFLMLQKLNSKIFPLALCSASLGVTLLIAQMIFTVLKPLFTGAA